MSSSQGLRPGVRVLTREQASRVALEAQGFGRRDVAPTLRTLGQVVARTGVLQVDSVNVLARAHLMPLYARMGAYDTDLLTRAASGRESRRLVEYWAHVQAFMPVELWPLMRHRMDDYLAARGKWGVRADPEHSDRVLAAVALEGPVTARQLDAEFSGPRSSEQWGWNWSEARRTLDFLFMSGQVAISGRTPAFEVLYDLPERVLPARVLATPVPAREDAERELVLRAVRSHGVGTLGCFADYHRMRTPVVRRALAELEESGEVVEVQVRGWGRPTWMAAGQRVPRSVEATTVLSPFDPLVWYRERAEALFDFRYRIEIYVPEAQRVHGYYVLPFLHDGRLVARVDLKADRARGLLLVRGTFAEPDAPESTAAALAAELHRLGDWVGTPQVLVERRGDLAPALAVEVALHP